MISMNMSPPRPSDASSVAMLPAVKARMRKRPSRNIGSSIRVSITAKIASRTSPPPMHTSTLGDVHPIVWPPYGWIP
jgi:hypothetical protein